MAYLSSIGGGIAALSGLGILLRWLGLTRHRYIRNGIPVVARVVELVKTPVMIVSGEATHYAFTAMVEYRDPQTNELVHRQLMSPHFGSRNRDEFTTSFKIGDYVTVVYLPGKYPKSLQLFAFLDLVPGLGVVRRPTSGRARVLWRAPLMTVAVFGIFAILLWNIYAFDCLHPIAFDYRKSIAPIFAGGTSLTALFVGGAWISHRRDQRRTAEGNARAIAQGDAVELGPASFWGQRGLYGFVIKALAIPGMFLIGGLTTLCWCFTANSLFDKSPAVLKAVEIDGIKGRKVTFRFPGAAEAHQVFAIRGKPLDFPDKKAIAVMHEGRLGWAWVKELRPAVPPK